MGTQQLNEKERKQARKKERKKERSITLGKLSGNMDEIIQTQINFAAVLYKQCLPELCH